MQQTSLKTIVTTNDVTALFRQLGIETNSPILIQESSGETYSFEANPTDNWVYAALRGFQNLQQKLVSENRTCRHFITVGTGPGIDAIGAYHIFHPNFIRVTDINEVAANLALKNLRANTSTDTNLYCAASVGNLLEIDLSWGMPVPPPDVIYGNLPNIPATEVNTATTEAATFIDKKLITDCPPNLDKHLLALQYKFLCEARTKLAEGGSVIIALGARISYGIIKELFKEANLKLEELFTFFKIQTQPTDVISGYAQAGKENGVVFTFYDYDAVLQSGIVLDSPTDKLERSLQPFALSADRALIAHKTGKRIGHIVSILRGIK